MGRLLARFYTATSGRFSTPVSAPQLPCKLPGFLQGDPRQKIPNTCELLQQQCQLLLPWTRDNDLLIAPYPAIGDESIDLLALLKPLAAHYPVLLYSAGTPLWANIQIGDEGLLLLPARRLSQLLCGSFWAEMQPGTDRSLQGRRFLSLALDYQRSLAVLAEVARLPRLVGEVRLEGELDLLFSGQGGQVLDAGARKSLFQARPPRRVHLPWWGENWFPSWKLNRLLLRQWPGDWAQVELQFRVGEKYLRLPAKDYWRAFRQSGAHRRIFFGRINA
jgi:hypothetical protein